jgi:hypothetical protein
MKIYIKKMVYYQVKNKHLLKLLGGSRQGNVWGALQP